MGREDCDIRVAMGEERGAIMVRRTATTVWLQPDDGLDGDGELALSFDNLVFALGTLGFTINEFQREMP